MIQGLAALAGRILVALIFLQSGIEKFISNFQSRSVSIKKRSSGRRFVQRQLPPSADAAMSFTM